MTDKTNDQTGGAVLRHSDGIAAARTMIVLRGNADQVFASYAIARVVSNLHRERET